MCDRCWAPSLLKLRLLLLLFGFLFEPLQGDFLRLRLNWFAKDLRQQVSRQPDSIIAPLLSGSFQRGGASR